MAQPPDKAQRTSAPLEYLVPEEDASPARLKYLHEVFKVFAPHRDPDAKRVTDRAELQQGFITPDSCGWFNDNSWAS